MPQLDSLRTFALLSVFVAHYTLGWQAPGLLRPILALHWARFGVIHFFVLSGFLITTILLRVSDSTPRGASKLTRIKNFYIRRFLRIFPIYYLTILVLLLIGYAPIRENLLWLVTYTMNMNHAGLLGMRGDYGVAGHLWSLSVEEQFYLFWPYVVFFVPRRHLPRVLFLMMGLGVLSKFVRATQGLTWMSTNFVLPGALDSLSMGALLACYRVYPEKHGAQLRHLLRLGWLIGIPAFIALQVTRVQLDWGREHVIYRSLIDLTIALPSIWIINRAAQNSSGILGKILMPRPLRRLGRITYSGYLFHNFLRLVELPFSVPLTALIYTISTFAISTVSWHAFENPINRLKRKYPYYRAAP